MKIFAIIGLPLRWQRIQFITIEQDTQHHFIREPVAERSIKLEYHNSNKQVTDLFTKSLSLKKFAYFRNNLGLVDFLY